jgi:hypothetical protein
MISPAQFVISKFGGLTGTATAIGAPITTVQGWKDRGRIPQDHWRKLMEAAEQRGERLIITDFIEEHPEPNEGSDMARAS